MKAQFTFDKKEYHADLSDPIDLSIGIRSGAQNLNAFYADDPEIKPFTSGDFIGSVKLGAPVNTNNIRFNPHGNGTHTECYGHITREMQSVNQLIRSYHLPTLIISVTPKDHKGDRIITDDLLADQCHGRIPDALIIRTMPNDASKMERKYSGNNPPYFHQNAMQWIREKGVKHLLVDLPSVDREQDEGKLACHHIFWDTDNDPRSDCSITELIYVANQVKDGLYLLNLQIAPFENDASPSRPVVYNARTISK